MGTEVVGYVKDINGKPIINATVTLYGSPVKTDAHGCFYFNKADALPFELAATASGYNPVKAEAQWGKFKVRVTLARDKQNEQSTIIWEKSNGNVGSCT